MTVNTKHFGEVVLTNENNKHKGAIKDFFGKLSRGLMLPISMLPIAGILIGLGSIFTDNSIIHNQGVNIFGQYLTFPGKIVFSSLPGLFAIAIAVTFTKDSGPAGVCAFLG
jgi:PTS system glucose-specific IIC component